MTEKDRDNELLQDLLIRWEELVELGQETSAEDLCRENPNLVTELARRIRAMKATSWLDSPREIDEAARSIQPSTFTKAQVLGERYRLDDLIAEGGYGLVWRAYDLELQRFVAIKSPKQTIRHSNDKFLAEARRVAKLDHPGILPIYDVGVEGGCCFIVSALVEGGSLADIFERASPTRSQGICWIIQIAEALEYAHQNGVVHRDIKPANILIDHHNRALLTDFGIARSTGLPRREIESLGTLRYMSAEQLEGNATDFRSDIYSLGIVIYEMVTGRLPYSSLSPNVLRREISTGIKIDSISGFPHELRRICAKALAREPQRRYQSAAHLIADLKRYLNCQSASWIPWVATGVLVIGGVAGYTFWRNEFQTGLKPRNVNSETLEANKQVIGVKQLSATTPKAFDAGTIRSDNGLGMKMVYCPPGEFLMGCAESESDAESDEMPQVPVTLTRGFWIGQYEVTQAEYFRITGMAPWKGKEFVKELPDAAASYISWTDAQKFCKLLTIQEQGSKSLQDDELYRLPTEAEWEYACRAGTKTRYSFGDEPSQLADYAWFKDNTHLGDERYTHRVGQKLPNPWGIFDMHGNAWEWCLDRYLDKRLGGVNPRGGETGEYRVMRGAGWTSTAISCRTSDRDTHLPNVAKYYVGVRVVRVARE